jgi:hypothetical protein
VILSGYACSKSSKIGVVKEKTFMGQTQHVHDRITVDAAICHGKPCIRGLRYLVETVLE